MQTEDISNNGCSGTIEVQKLSSESEIPDKAMEEQEEPFDFQTGSLDTSIGAQEIDKEERKAKRVEKRYFSAFRLIVGCLIFLGAIYLFDSLFTIRYGKVSSTTEGIIEIVKTLLFTLSGYLFARKENGEN